MSPQINEDIARLTLLLELGPVQSEHARNLARMMDIPPEQRTSLFSESIRELDLDSHQNWPNGRDVMPALFRREAETLENPPENEGQFYILYPISHRVAEIWNKQDYDAIPDGLTENTPERLLHHFVQNQWVSFPNTYEGTVLDHQEKLDLLPDLLQNKPLIEVPGFEMRGYEWLQLLLPEELRTEPMPPFEGPDLPEPE